MRNPIVLLLAAACLPACAPADRSAPTPASVTIEQFRQLRWIEGRWHGAEAGGAPFFESYRMIDDSTIASATWADATFSHRTDSSLIRLRKGEVTSGPNYAATQWDGSSVRFDPIGTAANSFIWKKEGPDRWTARLQWQENGQDRERTYIMTRIAE